MVLFNNSNHVVTAFKSLHHITGTEYHIHKIEINENLMSAKYNTL